MKVYMLNPPYFPKFGRGARWQDTGRGGTLYYPIWLSYASAVIEQEHRIRLVDAPAWNWDLKDILQDIKKFKPNIVVIDSSFPSLKNDLMIAERIKENFEVKTVMVGPPTSQFPEKILKSKGMDIVARLEYDFTIEELARNIEKDNDLRYVAGISYKKNGKIFHNPDRDFTTSEGLDRIPFVSNIYKRYLNIEDYFLGQSLHPEVQIFTGRGCPYSCIYCCVGKISGKKWRYRTPKNIISELEFAKSKYNSKAFRILDDNFTQDINRAKKFCQLLIDYNINMGWSCPNGIRAEKLDEELASLMKDSGCKKVSIGIESLDSNVFNSIMKGEKLEDIECAIDLLDKYGINVVGFFIIGLPNDNLSRTKSSIECANKLNLDRAYWSLLVPYPGTEVWHWVNKNAKILRDWKRGFHFGAKIKPVFETKDFSEKERAHAYKLGNIKCKNYIAFYDEKKSFLFNALNMLKLVLKYDLRNLPSHLMYCLKNANLIYNKAARRFQITNRDIKCHI